MSVGDELATPVPCVSQNQSTGETIVHQSTGGLTKREHFICAAMQGYASNPQAWDVHDSKLAAYAIAFADAMVVALNTERREDARGVGEL